MPSHHHHHRCCWWRVFGADDELDDDDDAGKEEVPVTSLSSPLFHSIFFFCSPCMVQGMAPCVCALARMSLAKTLFFSQTPILACVLPSRPCSSSNLLA
jgi:hypothetical protein